MKPAAMVRALQRAETARWVAGREARTLHLKALTTAHRESTEDHREMEGEQYLADMQRQMAFMLMAYGLPVPPGILTGISPVLPQG